MRKFICAAALGALAFLSVATFEREATACGGCFHPPGESGTVVTDHRMIFTVSTTKTTLYDQIKYAGSPETFAWVLPTTSLVTVGLSSDVVFTALEQTTATAILAPGPSCPCGFSSGGTSGGTSGATSGGTGGGVTVLQRQVVGPYETVQLEAGSSFALTNWLAQNGYNVPSDIVPVINAYCGSPDARFLVMKLRPGKGVQDMRPVRVSSDIGAGLSLPLRMVAAGTGAAVGVTLWVLGEGRYEPQNFPSFTIDPSELTWDWVANRSNYTDLRTTRAAHPGRSWEIESSTPLSRENLEAIVKSNRGTLATEEENARWSYDPIEVDGGVLKTAVQVREEDLTTLFGGVSRSSGRITRLRADLSRAALNADLTLRAASDQRIFSNVRQVTVATNTFSGCPPADTCTSGATSGTSAGGTSGAAGASIGGGGGTFECASEPFGFGDNCAVVAVGFCAVVLIRAKRRQRRP